MANVKITDLTALSAGDAVDTDVFVIVDISADQTKKMTKAELVTAVAAANDFVTFTQLNANLNTVSANAAAVETRRTNNIAGAISTVTTSDLTASRALVTNGSGKIAISDVTSTEIGYLDGVTSAIQTQFTGAETRRTNNIAGAVSTVTTSDLTADRAVISNGSGKLAISAVTSTEVGYLDGVSSAIQTQLDAKQATITGGATTIDTEDLTASRALVSSGSGKVAVSAVTSTEIGYLDGVTSSIQTQIDAAQATFANAHYTTTTANSYNIGTTVANINETDVYLDGIYQIKNQYVLANSSHNVQFKEATFTAGVGLEIVSHT
mgnify:CR=1 FL=1|tara:strand:+ start:214 stop:1179 length:966 start_codon:yes stop_codon:yes gene_type:complete